MLSSMVIVFREVIEAALIVTIVLAATKGVTNRGRWVLGGVGAGIVGAMIVASLAETIAASLDGLGQEVFNAIVLFCAVIMLAWHNIWMAKHSKSMVDNIKRLGREVSIGLIPMQFLCVTVALAILREGSEIVLFMYGFLAGGSRYIPVFSGALLGLVSGVLVGAMIYAGLLQLKIKRLFQVTSYLIILLASGLAASGAGYLEQAGYLPSGKPIWDSSAFLPEHSTIGQILHVLIGYQDRPTALQGVFYGLTFLVILTGMYLTSSSSDRSMPEKSSIA